MKVAAYFWDGKQVVPEACVYNPVIRKIHLDMPCVDLREDLPNRRYGVFNKEGWFHIPIEKFPPEFRMHLLLLGVA